MTHADKAQRAEALSKREPLGSRLRPDTGFVTRFAPSPTGYLHLGHAYSAWIAARLAGPEGRFLVRIENLDQGRSRPEFEDGIVEDLTWLGLGFETPLLRQSARSAAYGEALDRLRAMDLLYPCFCSRKDIAGAAAAPHGLDGPVYPGTCLGLSAEDVRGRMEQSRPHVLRLRMDKAMDRIGGAISFVEQGEGPDGEHGAVAADPAPFGDIVLTRKDGAAAYHLAVVIDDAFQGVTLVPRGRDLFPATAVHRLLQCLLGLPEPAYHHHKLVVDETGKRLAKRDMARTLRSLREDGLSAGEVLARAVRFATG